MIGNDRCRSDSQRSEPRSVRFRGPGCVTTLAQVVRRTRPWSSTTFLAVYSCFANIHFKCRYGQILPADTQSHARRSTSLDIDWLSLLTSNNSSNAGTDRRERERTQPTIGPFSQSGIGELNPTLRARIRIESGIWSSMARRATIFV